jgi:hypothetical protein
VAPDQLRVSATNNPFQSSPRGARVGANSIPAVTAGFFLSGMQQGSAVHLFIDIKRTMIPMGFQLLEVYPLFHFTAVADGQGTAQFSFPITPSLARVNFFAQAAWVEPEPSGVVHLTNSVNLWVRGP